MDAARWDWMGEISIAGWKEIWQRQATWEEMGGRTFSWVVTEWLR